MLVSLNYIAKRPCGALGRVCIFKVRQSRIMTIPAVWPWRENLWPPWASISSSIKWDQWILPQLSWGLKGLFLQSLACRRCSVSFMPVLTLRLVGWLKDHSQKRLHRLTWPDSHPTTYPKWQLKDSGLALSCAISEILWHYKRKADTASLPGESQRKD